MTKRLVTWLCFFSLFLAVPGAAHAVRATGEGPTQSAALNSALQQAVELAIGTDVDSLSLVEEGRLIKDDIISHAKGYVSRYEVIRKEERDKGYYFIEIEAQVDQGLIRDNIESLEILMKMVGRPKVLVIGLDDESDSLSTVSKDFVKLVQELGELFKEKFRFRLLDHKGVTSKAGAGFTPKPDKSEALDMALSMGVDILVFVKVNARHSSSTRNIDGEVILEAVRISDRFHLGVSRASFDTYAGKKSQSPAYNDRLALAEAEDHLFQTGTKLARKVVEGLQREAERGAGLRYVVTFYGFPKEVIDQIVPGIMEEITGYVRHKVEHVDKRKTRIIYWSHLPLKRLDHSITAQMIERDVAFQHRLSGRTLQYKWKHPLFD